MVLKQIYRPGLGDSKVYHVSVYKVRFVISSFYQVTYSPVRTIQAVSRFRNLPEKPYLIQ